jgi:hypothetical protein
MDLCSHLLEEFFLDQATSLLENLDPIQIVNWASIAWLIQEYIENGLADQVLRLTEDVRQQNPEFQPLKAIVLFSYVLDLFSIRSP